MFVGLHGDETYNILFVETPRKFITAKLSIRKPGSSSQGILLAMMKILALMKSGLTDRKPYIITLTNLCGVSTNKILY
jgi:hypothetical protein